MLLLGAMGAGALCGWLFPAFSGHLEILGTLFLRLIRTIVAPLLFGVLVPSMARAGSLRALGRMGFKAVVFFEVMTTLALLWGLAWTVAFQPGAGFSLHGAPAPSEAPSLRKIVEDAFPGSIVDAMARGDVLQMVIFFLMLGLAANALGPKAEPLVAFAESVAAVIFRCTRLIMWAAPLAIFGSMAATIAGQGSQALSPLAKLIATAWGAQLSYTVLVLGGVLLLVRFPVLRFLREVKEPFLVAFTTTSSAAALPAALKSVDRMGIPPAISGFVTPLSLSFNLEGSTIHLMMAAVFAAQAAQISLGWEPLLLLLVTLKLTSKGVAGIPRANFVILTALFAGFGLPAEALTLLLGIDALIDPVRTALNILGHCTAPVVVARWGPAPPASPPGTA